MKRSLYLIAGWIAFALGVVGAFLPVLPTTPFMILAAFCFSRSSPRLHRWLLSRPKLGPLIQDWESNRVIPVRIKAYAISMIIATGALSGWTLQEKPWGLRLGLAALLMTGIGLILAQKSRV